MGPRRWMRCLVVATAVSLASGCVIVPYKPKAEVVEQKDVQVEAWNFRVTLERRQQIKDFSEAIADEDKDIRVVPPQEFLDVAFAADDVSLARLLEPETCARVREKLGTSYAVLIGEVTSSTTDEHGMMIPYIGFYGAMTSKENAQAVATVIDLVNAKPLTAVNSSAHGRTSGLGFFYGLFIVPMSESSARDGLARSVVADIRAHAGPGKVSIAVLGAERVVADEPVDPDAPGGQSVTAGAPAGTSADGIVAAEGEFLDFLDAHGQLAVVESGLTATYLGKDRKEWQSLADARRRLLDQSLGRMQDANLTAADARAANAMRQSVSALAAEVATTGVREPVCADAQKRDLTYAQLRAALVACYVELGNNLQIEGRTVDRSSALQLLHVVDEPARRKAIFDAFVPLWTALNGRGEADSPYRRMIAMAAADAAAHGSAIDAAASAIGIKQEDVERWLLEILNAWRQATGPDMVEPWDYRYRNSAANRELAAAIPAESLLPASRRFYADLGADLTRLSVMFDLEPRAGKSPLAYTDFVTRGRMTDGRWQPSVARVVGTYPTGGLYSLNELVHEDGHAVHVSAIRTRPAYMDWPDTLFTEAFADVPSWSVYEVVWQKKYLGVAAAEPSSLRALYGDVMLDVAWAEFELQMLRDPQADPNMVWTVLTSAYLHIVPHPEIPWWAVRVQLASDPGYMVNYGLGAVLTAEMRQRAVEVIGPFDAGNAAWYGWTSSRLLRYGSERSAGELMQALLGRPVSTAALLSQIERCGAPALTSAPAR